MKNTRRIKRMARAKKHRTVLNLTSLMDVFTILVFFLLVNQSTTEVLQTPKDIVLPDSIVESKPRQTIVIHVSDEQVLVQGEFVASVADIIESTDEHIAPMHDRLVKLQESVIGLNTQLVAESREVTILANKDIPFKVLRKLMATCTSSGYTRISLAVNQSARQG
jgi:biopolymer transport protein ExbD